MSEGFVVLLCVGVPGVVLIGGLVWVAYGFMACLTPSESDVRLQAAGVLEAARELLDDGAEIVCVACGSSERLAVFSEVSAGDEFVVGWPLSLLATVDVTNAALYATRKVVYLEWTDG